MKSVKQAIFFLLCTAFFSMSAAADSGPVLALTQAPGLGDASRFEGVVFLSDGNLDASAYAVAAYIQPDDGPNYYYKPYDGAGASVLTARRTTDGRAVGTFSLTYWSEGAYAANDRNAKYVILLLLPAGLDPRSNNYAAMRAAALDVVTVTRTADGVSVAPNLTPPALVNGPDGRDPGLTVSPGKIALNIGFHTDGSEIGSTLTEAHIRRHLEAVASWADPVRFYNSSEALKPAYRIAHEMGFTVVATAYLTADDAANRQELDRAAELVNSGLARICCVGNECLSTGDISAGQLLSYIAYLRNKVTVKDAYITTAETVQALLQHDDVRDACDFLFMHDYPYLGGEGAIALTEDYLNLRAKNNNPNFKIYVGETGHPTAGGVHGNAAAGEAEAAQYFAQVRAWSLAQGVPTFFFSAFDEPAKPGEEVERHFGILDASLNMKPAYAALDAFQSVAAHIYGNSLDLLGNIGVNFYLTLPDALTADPGAYVTLDGTPYLIRDARDGDYYKFTRPVAAKEMNVRTMLRVFDGRGYPYLFLDSSGADYTQGYSASVADYLQKVRDRYDAGPLLTLAKAMSDYGSCAQRCFSYDVDRAAPLSDALASVSVDDFAPYQSTVTPSGGGGVRYVGSNLTLESETTLRHFFRIDDGRSVDEYAFTVDGNAVAPVARPEGYAVEIPGIVAKRLNVAHPVTVRDKGSGAVLISIGNYSPLSYGLTALRDASTDDALKTLVKSLYLYHRAAADYFNA